MYPIITTRQMTSEYNSCNRCGWVEENQSNPVPITEITFKTSESGGMSIRYCDTHLAEMLAELSTAVEEVVESRLTIVPKGELESRVLKKLWGEAKE